MMALRRFRVLVSLSMLSAGLVAGGAPPAGADHIVPPPGGFFPLTPARLLDTRTGVGAPAAKVGPGQEVELQVTGRSGVPTDQVTAVALNIAVTEPTAEGYLTAYPTGEARPVASNTNFVAGQTLSTAAVVKLGTGGRITLFNSSGSSHVVVDVGGWHARFREAGTPYTPVSPARVFDSRAGQPIGPGGTATVDVSRGVPGMKAVALNVTATGPTASTFITVHPAGEALPLAANLNVVPGQTRGNFVAVKVSDGAVKIYNNSGTTHIVVDVLGYWSPASGSRLNPITPVRAMDTRIPGWAPFEGGLGAQQTMLLPTALASLNPVYDAAAAVVLNVAVTQPTTDGWLTLFAGGSERPYASNLNYKAGETVPNLVVVPVNELWHVNVFTSGGPVHLVVDIVGWYDDLDPREQPPVYERDVPGLVFWESDVVVDPTSTFAYVSNSGMDRIEVLRLEDGMFEAPIAVGPAPMGLDLSPAGDRLYAGTAAGVSVVDLAARRELGRISIPDRPGNRPFDVAVLADGTALVSTTFGGSGFGASLFKVDLSTGTATLRTDFWPISTRTWMKASGDRLSAIVVLGETSPTTVARYVAGSDAFTASVSVPGYARGVATNVDGSVTIAVGRRFGPELQNGEVSCDGFGAGGSTPAGVAVTAAGHVGYAIRPDAIHVCNLGFPTPARSMNFHADGVGQLALTPDETRLVGITSTGVVVGKPFG